ncbi:hypothetical protein SAMN04487857_11191 [Pseudomonas sp. ok272]|nr:hypothetical protein SAMN04487857_11191 [Pseudomonas sp. ok272]SFN10460.1 hypothetical protein SAMN04487858_11291 [Pseudomonas sp. ok602]
MGKNSAYRESKLRERAQLLADEQDVSFEDALSIVKERRAETMKALKRSGNGAKVLVKRQVQSTPFTRLKEKVHGSTRPLQGGAPGQGKRS